MVLFFVGGGGDAASKLETFAGILNHISKFISWSLFTLTNLMLVSREPLLYLEFNKPNKQNVSEINFLKKFNFFQCQNNC